ncbi:hypothetical protein [Verrucomicrobium spinosum]|uniref:hypothetical protein n=1 Tax=Verrucomicrobium spinosum TaxID=2736 RepID=UPI00155DCF3C|nr:hypothetical protein [Verrucomicrobium spinosum]
MLAKILSERHGFDTTVVFSINPASGEVDPEARATIPAWKPGFRRPLHHAPALPHLAR